MKSLWGVVRIKAFSRDFSHVFKKMDLDLFPIIKSSQLKCIWIIMEGVHIMSDRSNLPLRAASASNNRWKQKHLYDPFKSQSRNVESNSLSNDIHTYCNDKLSHFISSDLQLVCFSFVSSPKRGEWMGFSLTAWILREVRRYSCTSYVVTPTLKSKFKICWKCSRFALSRMAQAKY